MDLPIDHFRLLGVSPAADAETVLRTLQRRLDHGPEGGFSAEALAARADLLRSSADLLGDRERRMTYESELTSLKDVQETAPIQLSIPSTQEVGGLLLLLESGQAQECLDLAFRSLQPPQAPAFGSSREADLVLLAGQAALATAEEMQVQRHYESSARLLEQGLALLQRMGKLPELRETMNHELLRLTPYRVLDLLSRDPSAVEERGEGLALLEDLVRRRGGLEGDADPEFPAESFQRFFKQIRGFLTVQEQIDLFSRWGDQGSAAADFLASMALTASGFAQRKPERIAAARSRLLASGRPGTIALIANLDLLLGDVTKAQESFALGADDDLRAWVTRQSEDPLGQLCAWCRDWLGRDVLPGYRDVDAEADLEAYFSDRDVVAWVEREDQRRGRTIGAAFPSGARKPDPFRFDFGSSQDHEGLRFGADDHAPVDEDHELEAPLPRWDLSALRRWGGSLGLGGRAPWLLGGLAGVVALLVYSAWLLRPKPTPLPSQVPQAKVHSQLPSPGVTPPPEVAGTTRLVPASPPSPSPAPMVPPSGSSAPPTSQLPPAPAPLAVPPLRPLTASNPDKAEMEDLLMAWLRVKTTVLAGDPAPPILDQIARDGPIELLLKERSQDRAQGHIQKLDVTIKDSTITERSPDRLVVMATLAYSDSRLDGTGKVVTTTPPITLRNEYVFGRDGGNWRLVATRRAG